jgi:Deacetylase PdaC/HNH endonuclease/Protein of unknown function (DUF3298)
MISLRRPSIPADLRRRVLVEAGHRCAIHTCRYPDVDVHHIEPWAKVREHRFENMIALCSNCHRRADAGEIDRKSLLIYKARLGAAFRYEDFDVYPEEILESPSFAWVDANARWRTLVLREVDPDVGLEAELEYPEFESLASSKDLAVINAAVSEYSAGALSEFREHVYSSESRQYPSSLGCQLNASFAVSLLSSQLISVRFGLYSFAGGAHGSHWAGVVNYFLDPAQPLGLADLFDDLDAGVSMLSRCCISKLLAPSDEPRDEGWVRGGAGPDISNFSSFNLTPEGVLVTFDEYAVGPYVQGASEILVPYATLDPILAEPFRRALLKTKKGIG